MSIPDEVHGTCVSLVPLRSSDIAPDYIAWLNDPEIMRFTEAGHGEHNLASVLEYIASAESNPRILLWRIMKDGMHIGNIRLSGINRHHKRCEIAVVIGQKDKWGSGAGPVAIDLASQYAFSALGLRKVSALIYAENERSIRAFKKAGFQEEARLKNHFLIDRRDIDGIWMCRFKSD